MLILAAKRKKGAGAVGLMDKSTMLMYLMRAIVMLMAIPAHEAAHAYVSAKLGDTTARDCGRLTLNPRPTLI